MAPAGDTRTCDRCQASAAWRGDCCGSGAGARKAASEAGAGEGEGAGRFLIVTMRLLFGGPGVGVALIGDAGWGRAAEVAGERFRAYVEVQRQRQRQQLRRPCWLL